MDDELSAKDEILVPPSVSSSLSILSQYTVTYPVKSSVNISSPLPVKRGLAEQKVIRTPNAKLNLDDDQQRKTIVEPKHMRFDSNSKVAKVAKNLNLSTEFNSVTSTANSNALVPTSKLKQYQCALCPNDPPYAGASGLWYHMKRHHGAKTRPYNKRKEDEMKAKRLAQKKMKKLKKSRDSLKKEKKTLAKRNSKKNIVGLKRGRPLSMKQKEKKTPARLPKNFGGKHKVGAKHVILGKNGKPLSKYMMKKREAMLEKEKAKQKISQLVHNWLKTHNYSEDGSSLEDQNEASEQSNDEESNDSDVSQESSDDNSEDDEIPTISRNNDMMKLVKHSNQHCPSYFKKYSTSQNMDEDPFLLLAEVAECVSPRKKKTAKFSSTGFTQATGNNNAFPSSPSHKK